MGVISPRPNFTWTGYALAVMEAKMRFRLDEFKARTGSFLIYFPCWQFQNMLCRSLFPCLNHRRDFLGAFWPSNLELLR
jgi:hypothetical protein